MLKSRVVVAALVGWLCVGVLAAAPQAPVSLSSPIVVASGLPGGWDGRATVVDIDGDSVNDIVVSTPGGGIWWIAGDNLAAPIMHAVVTGGAINMHSVADLDGDLDMDIATVSSAGTGWPGSCCGGEVRIYWNDGSGSFTSSQISAAVNGGRGISIGDISGDGLPDLVWSWREFGNPSIRYALNVGGGNFAAPVAVGYVPEAHDLQLSDLDGDGALDVVVAGWFQGTTVVFSNNLASSGGFVASILPGSQTFNRYVCIFDVNGDGRPEVLTTYLGSGAGSVWRSNSGNGTFGIPQAVISGFQTIPAGADLDLDGDDDVIVHDGTQLLFLESDGTTLRPAVSVASASGLGISGVSAGDIGDDGDADLVVISVGGDVLVYENQHASVLASAASYGAGCGSPSLQMTPSAPPLIGSVASTTISNAPLPFGGVTLGFSNTALGGLPILPFSLTGLGMPGCFLWHSNEISGLPIVPVSPGVLSFSAAIPGNANLLGTHVYLQAYCVDPNASPRKLIASNGIDWLIGNQ